MTRAGLAEECQFVGDKMAGEEVRCWARGHYRAHENPVFGPGELEAIAAPRVLQMRHQAAACPAGKHATDSRAGQA